MLCCSVVVPLVVSRWRRIVPGVAHLVVCNFLIGLQRERGDGVALDGCQNARRRHLDRGLAAALSEHRTGARNPSLVRPALSVQTRMMS